MDSESKVEEIQIKSEMTDTEMSHIDSFSHYSTIENDAELEEVKVKLESFVSYEVDLDFE